MSDEYDEIARRFFNQFLELKLQLDAGTVVRPPNYEKELRQWKRAAEEFKSAAQSLAGENEQLRQEVTDREEEVAKVRAQLNETLITLGTLQKKLEGLGVIRHEAKREGSGGTYSFLEHMNEESRRAFESLMREVPYRGTHGEPD